MPLIFPVIITVNDYGSLEFYEFNANMKDYFVSYTAADRPWAEWVAYKLEEMGYAVIIQVWDFAPGEDFVDLMDRALAETRHTIGIISSAYMCKAFPRSEMTASFVKDPLGKEKKFIPIRVEDFSIDGLLSPKIYIDLVGLDEQSALRALKNGIGQSIESIRQKPESSPRFPSTTACRVPPGGVTAQNSNSNAWSAESRFKRFIHSRVMAADWLPQSITNPYLPPIDPTDEPAATEPIDLSCFIWMPSSEYFSKQNIDEFTPVVILCSKAAADLESLLRASLDPRIFPKLALPPSKLFNEDREALFPAIGRALQYCLLTALAVPRCLLASAASHPSIGYQTIVDLIVVPVLSLHEQIGIKSIHILLSDFGSANTYMLSQMKRTAKAILGRSKISYQVDIASSEPTAMRVCRVIAWGASRHHNRNDTRWIELLDDRLNPLGATPSRLD